MDSYTDCVWEDVKRNLLCTEALSEPVRSENESGFRFPSYVHSRGMVPVRKLKGKYVPFLHDSIVKTSTGNKMLFGSELRDRRIGPAFFKWHLSNLLPEELIKTIKQISHLEYVL